ncbi:TraB/GumN family protein [Salarchaeum japonicum]|uniref:TraB/GumN family protein n=1 Tax=Salarchaeum japonicum TaxID=555573 RepID=UPI003C7900DF
MSDESREGSVHLVGTAHVSSESVETVEREIEERDPDVVAVELDEGRYRQMKGDAPDDIDPKDLLRGSMAFQFLAYWLLSYVQQRMGERFDVSPGADMLAAVDTAEALGIDVALVDRNIQVTIQRFWTRMGFVEKLRMVGGLAFGLADPWTLGLALGFTGGGLLGLAVELLAGPFVLAGGGLLGVLTMLVEVVAIAAGGALVGGAVLGLLFARTGADDEYEELDMEDLTDTDVVSAMMEEFRRFSPRGAEALIDERDAYLAHNILALRQQGKDVLAVIGAGHVEGVKGYLDNPETLPPMESLQGREEKRFSIARLIGALMSVSVLVFFVLMAMSGLSTDILLKAFGVWFIVNAIFAGGFALAAGAHPFSTLAGAGSAWLTSLEPTLAPGWIAGYVELRYTPVSISDISTLNEIMSDEQAPIRDLLARMREVPLFKLIAIVALTNVGSMIGSPVALALMTGVSPKIDSFGEIKHYLGQGFNNIADILLALI